MQFHFHLDEKLTTSEILVPMLLVQPIIENSIWHGINGDKEGRIDIEIREEMGRLYYHIKDSRSTSRTPNVGGQQTEKRKSMGTTILKDQLVAISELERKNTTFDITKNDDKGREVVISIPLKPAF